jgi:hypothetical protein
MCHLDEHDVHVSIFDSGLLFAVDHHAEGTTSDGDTLVANTASNGGGVLIESSLYDCGGTAKDVCDFVTHFDCSFTKQLTQG